MAVWTAGRFRPYDSSARDTFRRQIMRLSCGAGQWGRSSRWLRLQRLTFGGNIIETGTDSYRLAQTRARAGHATS
jgi:hypothetical protein